MGLAVCSGVSVTQCVGFATLRSRERGCLLHEPRIPSTAGMFSSQGTNELQTSPSRHSAVQPLEPGGFNVLQMAKQEGQEPRLGGTV